MPLIPNIGDVFSGCEILARCGNGAYGITFLARNPLNSKVIIKIVGSLNSGERELAGLRNYMQVAGKHPNLLQIYHIGEHEDGFYYTMEAADNIGGDDKYVPATLGNFFRQHKKYSPEEAVAITRELAEGLQVMHDAGLIHRDIKPDNIIFVNGKPKLSDPGLVISMGEEASFAGTPGFIPPELLTDGGAIDQGADIYALGKVFYCLVTGQAPKFYPQLPVDMRIDICRQIYPAIVKLCNNKREKRCRNVKELLDCLPITLKKPTLPERLYEDFRSWKELNEAKYKFLKYTFATICLMVISMAAGYSFHQYRLVSEQHAIIKKLQTFRKINHDRTELILLQLQVYLPQKAEEYETLHANLTAAEKSANHQLIEKNLAKLEKFLAAAARELIPALPAETVNTAEGAAAAGKMHGFLAAPLAEYLPEKELKALKKQLKNFESKVFADWNGLLCGRDLETVQYYYMPLKFVPPGATVMRHSKKRAVIPYHFWIGKKEVMGEDFVLKMGIAPQMAPDGTRPVERVVWNDILFYCYKLNMILRNAGILPDNYIVRPPTEEEWEYAANNGWLGKDTTPLEQRANIKSNSQNRTWPAGRKLPSKLGLSDIYGNVAEIVQPSAPTKMQQCIVVRGGSFNSSESNCYRRVEQLKYQNIPYNVGFRLVVAPGDMDYFDREFFTGGVMQTKLRGKVYELIGANVGSFDWKKSDMVCRLLGGTLAEFEDQAHLSELKSALPLLGKWETFIGGVKVGDQWVWQQSRRKIDFNRWRKTKRSKNDIYLTLRGNLWDRTLNRNSAILLCQWDEKDYAERNQALHSGKKMPFEVCRFEYKDRRYILFDLHVHFLVAKRICELLGGSLATPDQEEVRKYIIEKLTPYSEINIFFGGYAKLDKWYWLNGKEAPAPQNTLQGGNIPTLNLNYTVLRNGQLNSSQSGSMFLCEWRINSASSH